MALDFYAQMAECLKSESVILATVIDTQGSVPREVGAKMLICADGRVLNTIGGGAGEAKVIEQAIQVLQTGQKQVVEIDLSGASQRQTLGICGGRMRVWLERWPGASAVVSDGSARMAILQAIQAGLRSGQSLTLVTPYSPDQDPYLLPANTPAPKHAFVEILEPPPTLLIVGAGHCALPLAHIADLIGFQIVVHDNRPQWATPDRFPQAAAIYTGAICEVMSELNQHTQLFAALVTRGYDHDVVALNALIGREPPCRYIGMIGSEKRMRQVFQALTSQGASPAQLQSIYAPIGLDIGALTPEEIAVSISAELILVRRGGTSRPLSASLRSV